MIRRLALTALALGIAIAAGAVAAAPPSFADSPASGTGPGMSRSAATAHSALTAARPVGRPSARSGSATPAAVARSHNFGQFAAAKYLSCSGTANISGTFGVDVTNVAASFEESTKDGVEQFKATLGWTTTISATLDVTAKATCTPGTALENLAATFTIDGVIVKLSPDFKLAINAHADITASQTTSQSITVSGKVGLDVPTVSHSITQEKPAVTASGSATFDALIGAEAEITAGVVRLDFQLMGGIHATATAQSSPAGVCVRGYPELLVTGTIEVTILKWHKGYEFLDHTWPITSIAGHSTTFTLGTCKLPAAAASWTELGGGAGHSSFAAQEAILGVGNAHAATIAWEATASGFSEAEPVVADGLAFIAAGDELDAVTTTDGTKIWTAEGSFRAAAPAVVDGLVIVGDQSGMLHAYNLETGTPLWTRGVGSVLPTLTAWGDSLVASTAGGSTVTAIDPASGALLWSRSVAGMVSGTAEADNTLIVTTSLGDVYGLNGASGAREWETTVSDGGSLLVPAIFGNSIYVAGPSAVTCLNLNTGRVLWQNADFNHTFGTNILSRPAADGSVVIVGLASGTLVSLAASTGRQVWQASAGPYVQAGTPAIANGLVWACNSSLQAFSLATGALVRSIAIPTLACNSSDPAVSDGSVYAVVLNLDTLTHLIAVRLPKN